MDGLPTELAKLCRLASMAECGDHFWESVPALGLWAAVWVPVTRCWSGWRAVVREVIKNPRAGNLQPGL
jgi:hypothetical protein